MDRNAIDQWARDFVAGLEVGGERVPLDRVIAVHLETFAVIRAQGLTWGAIASIVARAGGRRGNGRPISSDQLRADVARLLKRRETSERPASPQPRPTATPRPITHDGGALRPARPRPPVPACPKAAEISSPLHVGDDSKSVSNNEIAAALARIQRR